MQHPNTISFLERRNVVYMTLPDKPKDAAGAGAVPAAKAKAEAPKAAPKATIEPEPTPMWEKRVVPDTALLYRYSALTFNT
jgi:hydroxyacyl-ACP dehydratase HTD2-like protein with hotdog domain